MPDVSTGRTSMGAGAEKASTARKAGLPGHRHVHRDARARLPAQQRQPPREHILHSSPHVVTRHSHGRAAPRAPGAQCRLAGSSACMRPASAQVARIIAPVSSPRTSAARACTGRPRRAASKPGPCSSAPRARCGASPPRGTARAGARLAAGAVVADQHGQAGRQAGVQAAQRRIRGDQHMRQHRLRACA